MGFADGEIRLVNLQFDTVLFSFHMSEQAPIQSIAFSSDAGMGVSLMATVTKNGSSITLWDLNKQKIYSIL